jgi:hypothetical protein
MWRRFGDGAAFHGILTVSRRSRISRRRRRRSANVKVRASNGLFSAFSTVLLHFFPFLSSTKKEGRNF